MKMNQGIRRKNSLFLMEFFVLAFLLLMGAGYAGAAPIGTFSSDLSAAQTFWGDGAVYGDGYLQAPPVNMAGQKCLECHQGIPADFNPNVIIPDKRSYLRTGHGNMVVKTTPPPQAWNGANGLPYPTDASGHAIDWPTGKVDLGGWCSKTSGEGQFTQSGCVALGGTWTPGTRLVDIIYTIGGWMSVDAPDIGIMGGDLPANTFYMGDGRTYGTCGSCHNAGYKASDYTRPQPFADYSNLLKSAAAGVGGSWVLNGIQCERCHNATQHFAAPYTATVPTGASSTALCSQCHIRPAAYEGSANPNAATQPTAYPIGASATNFGSHLIGKQFLNSPHGLFTGPYGKIATTTEGLYNSSFSGGSSQGGCDTCHDVHQSTVSEAKKNFGAEPIKKGCDTCHPAEAQTALWSHPTGEGTMFPTKTSADVPGACVVCHMPKPVAGTGLNTHVFRINSDPNYSTFPKPGATTPGYCSDPKWTTRSDCIANGKAWSLVANSAPYEDYANAVWVDVDLACGQCHVGSGAAGITAPKNGAREMDKAALAQHAVRIHGDLGTTIHASAKANGSISPAGTTKVSSGGSQTYTITPKAGYNVEDVMVDFVSKGAITTYTFENVTSRRFISASFTPANYTITASVSGSGSITPSGTTTVKAGDSQTYTMTPNPGYIVSYVVVDGRNVGAPTSYTFTDVNWNHTIKPYFKVPK
jgi:hypothetical protein